jgi:hypothetical protein
VRSVHASIWRFAGDPDDLLRSYDAMLTDIPSASMRLHLCLRIPNGIVIVDTCPSPEAFEQFAARTVSRAAKPPPPARAQRCARRACPRSLHRWDPYARSVRDALAGRPLARTTATAEFTV